MESVAQEESVLEENADNIGFVYMSILVSVINHLFSHTHLVSLQSMTATLPICLLSSIPNDRLSVTVEPLY